MSTIIIALATAYLVIGFCFYVTLSLIFPGFWTPRIALYWIFRWLPHMVSVTWRYRGRNWRKPWVNWQLRPRSLTKK
jgi:hypothetical protein